MRADRLISLLLNLHAKGRMTAAVLAKHLEVSERTIYRDLDALSAAGVPVYTQPGQNGGIFLDEGYRVALTGLSLAEVRALFVSSEAGPLNDLGLSKAVEGTLLKMMAALPQPQRREAERVRQRLHIDPKNWFQITEISPLLPQLQRAVWDDHVIEVDYQPIGGRYGRRELEAYALVAKANLWYLVARKSGGEMRNYRVSRFQNLALSEKRFERAESFDLAAYWEAACARYEAAANIFNPPYLAILRVHRDALWYFPAYMNGRHEILVDDETGSSTTLRAAFDSLFDARMRVLGLGTGVQVVEPDELRQAVQELARSIVDPVTG